MCAATENITLLHGSIFKQPNCLSCAQCSQAVTLVNEIGRAGRPSIPHARSTAADVPVTRVHFSELFSNHDVKFSPGTLELKLNNKTPHFLMRFQNTPGASEKCILGALWRVGG